MPTIKDLKMGQVWKVNNKGCKSGSHCSYFRFIEIMDIDVNIFSFNELDEDLKHTGECCVSAQLKGSCLRLDNLIELIKDVEDPVEQPKIAYCECVRCECCNKIIKTN